mgnify:CR=1 FL=1
MENPDLQIVRLLNSVRSPMSWKSDVFFAIGGPIEEVIRLLAIRKTFDHDAHVRHTILALASTCESCGFPAGHPCVGPCAFSSDLPLIPFERPGSQRPIFFDVSISPKVVTALSRVLHIADSADTDREHFEDLCRVSSWLEHNIPKSAFRTLG